MEETKKFPSLPPNYVSLQQLQEQRIREQQEKKKEKEEEQRLNEEQQKKEEEEELKKRRPVSQKAPRIKTSYDRTSNKNGRNLSQKSWLIKEKNEAAAAAAEVVENPDQKVDEVEAKKQKKRIRYKKNGASEIQKGEADINAAVEVEELPDPDQNHKENEKKKKKKKYKGKKPVAEEKTLTEDLPPLEITPAKIPNENDASVKNTRTGSRSRRRDNKPQPESVPLNQTMEIVENFGDLRVRDDEKKSTVEKIQNGNYSGTRRTRKIINQRKPMDGKLMWVRKDEKTDEFSGVPASLPGKFK